MTNSTMFCRQKLFDAGQAPHLIPPPNFVGDEIGLI